MAFLSKVGNLLRQTGSASRPSIYQAIRCMSSSKLFVGGISYATDDTSLREAFGKYGEVIEAKVILDRETGRSRGFGFITYTSSEEASSAIQALDGQDLHGRRIRVNYANDRPRSGFGGGGYGTGELYGAGGGYGSGGGYGTGGGYGAGGDYGSRGGYRAGGGYGSGGGYAAHGGEYGSGGGGGYNSNFGSSVGGYSGGSPSGDLGGGNTAGVGYNSNSGNSVGGYSGGSTSGDLGGGNTAGVFNSGGGRVEDADGAFVKPGLGFGGDNQLDAGESGNVVVSNEISESGLDNQFGDNSSSANDVAGTYEEGNSLDRDEDDDAGDFVKRA